LNRQAAASEPIAANTRAAGEMKSKTLYESREYKSGFQI